MTFYIGGGVQQGKPYEYEYLGYWRGNNVGGEQINYTIPTGRAESRKMLVLGHACVSATSRFINSITVGGQTPTEIDYVVPTPSEDSALGMYYLPDPGDGDQLVEVVFDDAPQAGGARLSAWAIYYLRDNTLNAFDSGFRTQPGGTIDLSLDHPGKRGPTLVTWGADDWNFSLTSDGFTQDYYQRDSGEFSYAGGHFISETPDAAHAVSLNWVGDDHCGIAASFT